MRVSGYTTESQINRRLKQPTRIPARWRGLGVSTGVGVMALQAPAALSMSGPCAQTAREGGAGGLEERAEVGMQGASGWVEEWARVALALACCGVGGLSEL